MTLFLPFCHAFDAFDDVETNGSGPRVLRPCRVSTSIFYQAIRSQKKAMVLFPSLCLVLATGAIATGVLTDSHTISETCEVIAAAVSSASAVHYSGPSYEEGIRHWASSSTERARCSFEPGTPSDVGIAVCPEYNPLLADFERDSFSYKFWGRTGFLLLLKAAATR